MDTAEAATGRFEIRGRLEGALTARAAGNLSSAVAILRDLVAREPTSHGLRCELAFTLQMVGAFEEAEALCLAVVDEDPTFAAALACLGHTHKAKGAMENALVWYRRAADAGLATPGLMTEIAGCLAALGRFSAAEDVYYDMLIAAPTSKAALHGLAEAYRSLGRPAAALFFFRRLAKEDAGDIAAQCDVGQMLSALGRLDEAAAAYRRAIAVAPHWPLPYRGAAHVAWLRGRSDEAAAILGEARGRGLLDAGGLLEFASALGEKAADLRQAGRLDEATETLHRAIEVDPGNFNARLQLAQLARQAGRWEDCNDLCDMLTRTYPGRIEGFAETCRVLAARGLKSEAVAVARGLSPTGLDEAGRHALRLEVARTCLDIDLAREAAQDLATCGETIVRLGFEVWAELVETLLAFGDAPGARAAIADAPAAAGAFQVARAYRLEGALASLEWRVDEARAQFEVAVANHADDPMANANLARLNFLCVDAEASAERLALFLAQSAPERAARGQSARLSQNLIGQLLNELRIDADLHAALRELAFEGGEGAIEPLLELVWRFPEVTAPAMALLLALRRAGLLGVAAAGEGGAEIPRSIMQVWPVGAPPPATWRAIKTCQSKNPGWRFAYYNVLTAREHLTRTCAPDVISAYDRAAATGHWENLFRLVWLHQHGGYHLAINDHAIGPVAPPGPRVFLVAFQDEFAAIGGPLLGCVPGEPVVGRALASATAALIRGDNDIPWLATGPGLLTRAFGQEMAERGSEWRSWLTTVSVGDRVAFRDVLTPGAVIVA
jgi:tetratricopeptide (TPR) repeat protein